jgi:hypothetical protein
MSALVINCSSPSLEARWLLPRKQSRRHATGAAVQGQKRPPALRKNSEPFRRRTTVKYDTDLY